MNGKGQASNTKPVVDGLDEKNFTTSEENLPSTYFAGVAKLNGAALMTPVITEVKNTPTAGAKK